MPDKDPARDRKAHDVLAAEEFVVPARDPALHHDPARDVLAAEEFVVPAKDPALHHGPVSLPSDPTGIAEPHDVLAAEEFALPAPPPGAQPATKRRARVPAAVVAAGALALLVTLKARKRRS